MTVINGGNGFHTSRGLKHRSGKGSMHKLNEVINDVIFTWVSKLY